MVDRGVSDPGTHGKSSLGQSEQTKVGAQRAPITNSHHTSKGSGARQRIALCRLSGDLSASRYGDFAALRANCLAPNAHSPPTAPPTYR